MPLGLPTAAGSQRLNALPNERPEQHGMAAGPLPEMRVARLGFAGTARAGAVKPIGLAGLNRPAAKLGVALLRNGRLDPAPVIDMNRTVRIGMIFCEEAVFDLANWKNPGLQAGDQGLRAAEKLLDNGDADIRRCHRDRMRDGQRRSLAIDPRGKVCCQNRSLAALLRRGRIEHGAAVAVASDKVTKPFQPPGR